MTAQSANPTIANAQTASGEEFPWGRIRWLCNGQLDPDTALTFGLVYIEPGESNALHLHPNCEELIFVMSGQCDHRLGDEWYPLTAGTMMRIPQNVPHCARNTGWEPVRMVITYSTPDRQTVFL